MRVRHVMTTLMACAVAACGGGGGGDESALLTPVEATMGQIPAGFSARYDPASDTLILDDGADPLVLQREARFELPPFRLYSFRTSESSARALRAETASGGGVAGIALRQDRSGSGFVGPFHARLSDTQLPSDGSATFVGDYAAFLARDLNFNFILKGDAVFTADFGRNTISGEITNRADSSEPLATYADIVLAPAAIVNGGFAGTARGGEGTGVLATTVEPGGYSGLFTGADGQEIVGGLVIAHDTVLSGDRLTEHGAFIAERTGP